MFWIVPVTSSGAMGVSACKNDYNYVCTKSRTIVHQSETKASQCMNKLNVACITP